MAGTLNSTPEMVDREFHPSETAQNDSTPAVLAEMSTKAPQFAQFAQTQIAAGRKVDHLATVKLEAEAVLGRSMMSVGEMLNLGVGSVVKLDRLVSEPVELLVQGVHVARGEIVVMNDHFAIRITEILGTNP